MGIGSKTPAMKMKTAACILGLSSIQKGGEYRLACVGASIQYTQRNVAYKLLCKMYLISELIDIFFALLQLLSV